MVAAIPILIVLVAYVWIGARHVDEVAHGL